MSIKSKIQNLIIAGNDTTGNDDTNLTDVIQSLIDGYGQTGTRYTIAWNLSRVTSSTTRSKIPEGQPLVATLTVETGYTLTSVVVLMNGVDITSSVYSNGRINIPAVTNNVVISAIAEASIAYSSFKGFISPFDGAYSDWMYDKMIPIGTKIYMHYNYRARHYDQNSTSHSRFICYNTVTETIEFQRECVYNGVPFAGGSMVYIDGVFYLWAWTQQARYSTSDFGLTWTKETCDSNINGVYASDNNYAFVTSTGRIISCPDSTTKKYYAYSDDLGLTWTWIQPFGSYSSDYQTTHNTFYEADGKIIAYLFGPYTARTDTVRYVSYSTDNGVTWAEPVACTGDLGVCGASFMTGSINCVNGEYHYVTAERIADTSDNSAGSLKWYKGSLSDLLNGTLTFVKTIEKQYVGSTTYGRLDDSGNMGGCVCNGDIYINWATHVTPPWRPTDFSTQGIRLYKLSSTQEQDAVVSAWNQNYKDRFNALLHGESTNHDYYLYNGGTDVDTSDTRDDSTLKYSWSGVNWSFVGRYKRAMPNTPNIRIPVGNSDFEVNMVLKVAFDNKYGQTTWQPQMFLGFEKADGTIHGLYHKEGGSFYGCFDAISSDVAYEGGLPYVTQGGTTCVTFKRTNGVLTFEIDGVTITNPIYSNIYNAEKFVIDDGVDEIFISLISNDGDVSEYTTYYNEIVANTSAQTYPGFSLLTVDVA